jgi:hypothetical protein
MKVNFNIFPGQHTITGFQHHRTTRSVLETRETSRFPPPTSLKQLEDVIKEEWHKNS